MITVVEAPERIVSLEEAKAHLRVTGAADDNLIGIFLDAAQGKIDGPKGWLGRSLGAQTLELALCEFPHCIVLPFGPVTSVVSIKYDDADGTEQTLDSDAYRLAGNVIELASGGSWPAVHDQLNSVRIRYEAGTVPVPAEAKSAVLLMTGIFFSHAKRDAQLKKSTVEGVGSREWDMSGNFDIAANKAAVSLVSGLKVWTV